MATSAFKSTTKRTPIGKSQASSSSTDDSSSSSANRTGSFHRRSRSLSRFSRPLPSALEEFSDEAPAPRGKFVNTTRGSGFPEISLDDLAVEFLGSADRGRSAKQEAEVRRSIDVKASVSQRRGRSVVRQSSRVAVDDKGSGGNSFSGRGVNSDNNASRRRRSVSVVRYQISDSENDRDRSRNPTNGSSSKAFKGGNSNDFVSNKTAASNHRPGLRRSFSQKDLKPYDGYSSNSSALTDDEGRDAYSNRNRNGNERTIRAVYSQKKAEHPTGENLNTEFYEVMRKELRHALEEIKMEYGQTVEKTKTFVLDSDDLVHHTNSEVLQAVSKRNYSMELEQSEKRKQDLLAEVELEEQRGKELSKIVKQLLPDRKSTAPEKPLRVRKRSNDRSRISRRLTEEAEKYFEDFICNVEDTDISSLDGERSDTSSTLGGKPKSETFQSPATHNRSIPVEMDGVTLPWLQWETCDDISPLSCKSKDLTSTPEANLRGPAQGTTPTHDSSIRSISSHGSWSPGIVDEHSTNRGDVAGVRFGELGSYHSKLPSGGTRSRFDVDEYLKRASNEDLLFDRWKQQQRIHSGSLLLCHPTLF